MARKKNVNILVMSDMHAPYHHPDTLAFYKAVRDEFDINVVKNVGDIVDNHMMSYHEYTTDALGPQEEFLQAKKTLQQLEQIFPEMTIVTGNHCSLNKRKAQTAGIPLEFLREYNDLYELAGGWEWKDEDLFDLGNGQKCFMAHSIGANTRSNAKMFSHCSVQGHHHGEFAIAYTRDRLQLRWSMSVGCTIDAKSPAMRYAARNQVNKAVIGCGVILNGRPMLVPMTIVKKPGADRARWNKKVTVL